jgi:hypothetical protein
MPIRIRIINAETNESLLAIGDMTVNIEGISILKPKGHFAPNLIRQKSLEMIK